MLSNTVTQRERSACRYPNTGKIFIFLYPIHVKGSTQPSSLGILIVSTGQIPLVPDRLAGMALGCLPQKRSLSGIMDILRTAMQMEWSLSQQRFQKRAEPLTLGKLTVISNCPVDRRSLFALPRSFLEQLKNKTRYRDWSPLFWKAVLDFFVRFSLQFHSLTLLHVPPYVDTVQ